MKKNVLEAMIELGLIVEKYDEENYRFSYEGHYFLYVPDDEYPEYLTIARPYVYDLVEGEEKRMFLICDKINETIPYIKAYIIHKSVWLYAETVVDDMDHLEQILIQMVSQLRCSYDAAMDIISKFEQMVID